MEKNYGVERRRLGLTPSNFPARVSALENEHWRGFKPAVPSRAQFLNNLRMEALTMHAEVKFGLLVV
jgi:hypothetical protein